MKRFIVCLLIAVLCVPLLSMPALAVNMYMNDVVADTKMPPGYVFPRMEMLQGNVYRREVNFFDSYSGIYLNIQFSGYLVFHKGNNNYTMWFSNPETIKMRAYPCNGRDVFTVTPENKMTIELPAEKVASIIGSGSGSNSGDTQYYYFTRYNEDFGNTVMESAPNGLGGYWYYLMIDGFKTDVSASTTQLDISLDVFLEELEIPITQEEFAQSHFDYYIVQKASSGVKSKIDYSVSFSHGDYLMLGDRNVMGYPVSISGDVWQADHIRYDNWAYYLVTTYTGNVTLVNSQNMVGYPSLSLDVLNRFLSHFGFDTIYYSNSNTVLSDDIAGLGDQMGDWGSQAAGFQDQAGGAVVGVTAMVNQFQPLFTGVWNILPGWVTALLIISLVYVVARKVLGR